LADEKGQDPVDLMMDLALDADLEIIPVINKIDLPSADVERAKLEIDRELGLDPEEAVLCSAKEGLGIEEILEAIVNRIPPPKGSVDKPLSAIIFDASYDPFRGAVISCRVFDGTVRVGDTIRLMSNKATYRVEEVGTFRLRREPRRELPAGTAGYIICGINTVSATRIGDTISLDADPAPEPLPGFRKVKPVVFSSVYPISSDDYHGLAEALEKYVLNDAALVYQKDSSAAMGQGFRCGFLGLLHLDIVRERLEREFYLSLVVTMPGVSFIITKTSGQKMPVVNPSDFPEPADIAKIEEPWVKISVITPSSFIGSLMELIAESEGVYKHTEYLGQARSTGEFGQRVRLEYELPLRSMMTTFYDQLKGCSRGYASLDYEFIGYREAKLVKLDVLVNDVPVDAFSRIVSPERAHDIGKAMVTKLKEVIPRQLFRVPIQAAVGSRVVAREDISAKRKDVLAKCYGGDITRKRKLLEKQKEGKKKMKNIGRVEVPQEAFVSALKLED